MTDHIGFTGTREGMTDEQHKGVTALFEALSRAQELDRPWLHHGDCIGSDLQAHNIASRLGWGICLHPPEDSRHRAWCEVRLGMVVQEPDHYLSRNRAIVQESRLLIATPRQAREIVRSGTWSTIRYARKQLGTDRVWVVNPDGEVVV